MKVVTMRVLRRVFSTLFLVIVFSTLPTVPLAHASPAPPVFDATVLSDSVLVTLNLQVSQNLTGLEPSFSLPSYNGTLTGANSTSLASLVQTAIDGKVPQATVKDLSLRLASTSLTGSAQFQWFNVSLQFRLTGVQTSQGGLEQVNMAWKSFNVPQNVTVGSVEVNNIGAVYLYSVANQIAQLERGAGTGGLVTYGNIVNFFRVSTADLASRTARINLFNFTQLLSPVDTWQQTYDFSSNAETWSFDLNQILGLMITITPKEPQATPSTNGVIYSIQAAVSAPARSWAQGDMINAVFNDNSENLMLGIIVSGLLVAATGFTIDRRLSKKSFRRKPRA
ncbi:hypothetical protein E6H17_03895 [Candidatus Bathyarchaeota archaeon]|nr:MAG: hypothetical protein E6H17_03895 [Candidatus Bathyarchaeota archaeon]